MSVPRCVMLGAGGHARVLLDVLRVARSARPVAVLDAAAPGRGGDVLGVPILGGDALLPYMRRLGVRHFVLGLGSTEDNGPRRRLYARAVAAGLLPLSVIHPHALISPFARLGAGCQVLPGSVINAGTRLGDNVIVNSGAIVEHDCRVGSHVHIATGARLGGGVTVEELAFIGLGACVRQGLTIGRAAVLGAGAVAVKDLAPGIVAAGSPARPLKRR